jgi:hypothetical protein
MRHGEARSVSHIIQLTSAMPWEVLSAYLDQSGTHGDSPSTVMGGMMARADQWGAFEKRFGGIRDRHGFRVFHTKKFKRRGGDFEGWSGPQGLALIADLRHLTCTSFTEGVAMLLDNAEFDRDYKFAKTPKRVRPP